MQDNYCFSIKICISLLLFFNQRSSCFAQFYNEPEKKNVILCSDFLALPSEGNCKSISEIYSHLKAVCSSVAGEQLKNPELV